MDSRCCLRSCLTTRKIVHQQQSYYSILGPRSGLDAVLTSAFLCPS